MGTGRIQQVERSPEVDSWAERYPTDDGTMDSPQRTHRPQPDDWDAIDRGSTVEALSLAGLTLAIASGLMSLLAVLTGTVEPTQHEIDQAVEVLTLQAAAKNDPGNQALLDEALQSGEAFLEEAPQLPLLDVVATWHGDLMVARILQDTEDVPR